MTGYTIGIDLGGTKIASALVAENGVPVFKAADLTRPEQGVDAVIERIASCVRNLQTLTDGPILGLGIGAAGMTDSLNGVVIMASNLRWKDVPLRHLLAEKLGQDWLENIWVDKDTNAAALGEWSYGAGRGSRHLLYVTVGTGIGGGMILDGRLYHGASQGGSDIGHLVMIPEGPLCGCGKRGCLEMLSSGPAIARAAVEALEAGAESLLHATHAMQSLSAQDVVEAARRADPLSQRILERSGTWLGRGLAYYVDINNPELIIIGGGVAAAGDLLLAPVRQAISRFALPANVETVRVLPAGLGADSGVIGAAALAWNHLEQATF